MNWVLSHIIPGTTTANPKFVDMNNVVHIDEKWFYLNPETRRFYLLPKEENPYRCQQSQRFKIKTMFMASIGKPVENANGAIIHDVKYGIFAFVIEQVAKKSSKNRKAGTTETKTMQNVTAEAIREMLMKNVIPSVVEKWPAKELGTNVYIQWDNAKPHKVPTDEDFIATTQQGLNIQMVFQPAQSPDLNVLDLGLFRSIQSIQYQSFLKNLPELIEKVEEAYNAFDPKVSKYTWLTLQSCMLKILKCDGGNNYKIPHMEKKRLDNVGLLPKNVKVSHIIVEQAVKYLQDRFRPANQEAIEATQETEATQMEVEVDAD